jgi:hypothetical protein
MQKRKSKRTPKTMTAGTFSSKFTTPSMTFAAAILSNSDLMKRPDLHQGRSQSVWDPIGNSSLSDDILRATIVIQHIKTELKNTDSEQFRIMAIIKIVLYLINKNGLPPRRTDGLSVVN